MRTEGAVLKVEEVRMARIWYSSLFFSDPVDEGEGWCTWREGVTVMTKDRWRDLYLLEDGESAGAVAVTPTSSIVVTHENFPLFLRMLAIRDDRERIVLRRDAVYLGRRAVILMDPDMNLVTVVERGTEEALMDRGESIEIERKGSEYASIVTKSE